MSTPPYTCTCLWLLLSKSCVPTLFLALTKSLPRLVLHFNRVSFASLLLDRLRKTWNLLYLCLHQLWFLSQSATLTSSSSSLSSHSSEKVCGNGQRSILFGGWRDVHAILLSLDWCTGWLHDRNRCGWNHLRLRNLWICWLGSCVAWK